LIAFVPSLDLIITRQTGSSGEWLFEEYLRQACAAVIDIPGPGIHSFRPANRGKPNVSTTRGKVDLSPNEMRP
jgi:hypothetical protein